MTLTYANGNAPDSALVFVDGIHMVPSIVERVQAFIAFAAIQGVTLRIAHPYGGYRNLHEQQQLTGTGNSGSTIPVAAAGKSTHGVYDVGRVDFVGADGLYYDADVLAWMVAHAGAFGLVREFGANDPNHFMASGPWTPPVTPKELDMDKLFLPTARPSSDGVIPNGAYFLQKGLDPLRVVSDFEATYIYGVVVNGKLVPPTQPGPDPQGRFLLCSVDPENLRGITKTYGIEAYTPATATAPLKLSGYVIYDDPQHPVNTRPGAMTLTAAQIAQIAAGVKVPAPDLTSILTAIAGIPAAVIKALAAVFTGTK